MQIHACADIYINTDTHVAQLVVSTADRQHVYADINIYTNVDIYICRYIYTHRYTCPAAL